MKELWTSLATLMGVIAFCQTVLHTVFPPQLRQLAVNLFNKLFHRYSSYCYFDIAEIDGVNTNELYDAVQLYLSNSPTITDNTRLTLTRAVNSASVTFGLSNNDVIVDSSFRNVAVFWEHFVVPRQSQSWRTVSEEKRSFSLKFRKQDKSVILDSYLDHIMDRSVEIRRSNQDRLLHTYSRNGQLDWRGQPWESVPFKHPSTFDTLAMEPSKKTEIMNDLKDFVDGKEFYERTGRAWKRGYLLYGAPGTGKSSMIAAMTNFLGYDIYDLELNEVRTDSELRKLLMKTSSKSIIVIEDIDCSINLANRTKRSNKTSTDVVPGEEIGNSFTLSGLLNFTDGLWSCCGSERIFVFTTNHIDKLDPALLRSGRMDMHILMSFCSFSSLKILLRNYLGLEECDLDDLVCKELESVIDKAEMTPADISEVLIRNRRNKAKAVTELLEVLKAKAKANSGLIEKE